MSVRVMVADDQELLRDALTTVLRRDPRIEVVAAVGDGAAAIDVVGTQPVDVVLMDVRMPVLDGIRATAEVRRVSPGTRVLVFTTFDLDEYVFAAIREGASGFLTKDARPAALIDAVLAVAAGDSVMSPRATAALLDHVRSGGVVADPRGSLDRLTARERDVFHQLAAGASNDEIARRLYLTANTVKTHVKAVLAKLDLPDRIHVVIWAYEHGVRRPGGSDPGPRPRG